MRLAIAVGILAQSIPAFSEKVPDFVLQERKFGLSDIVTTSIPHKADGSISNAPHKRRARRTQSALYNTHTKRTGRLLNQERTTQDNDQYCDPSTKDPDIGLLSCGQGRFCKRNEDSPMGGTCNPIPGNRLGLRSTFSSFGKRGIMNKAQEVNAMASFGTVLECDPTETGHADTGILACEDGQQCMESTSSSMGGFCMQTTPLRELNTLSEVGGVCDLLSQYNEYRDCDCSELANSTGAAVLSCILKQNYCLGLAYPGCAGTCYTETLDLKVANFSFSGYTSCLRFTTPYSQSFCIEQLYAVDSCTASFNDQPCSSCNRFINGNYTTISFDCSNATGPTEEYTYSIVSTLPIKNACYNPTNTAECRLCTIPNTGFDPSLSFTYVTVPNLGNFSCDGMFWNAYGLVSITDEYCPAVASVAADACCSPFCSLCESGHYIPETNDAIELNVPILGYEGVTCGDLFVAAYYNVNISEAACPSASSLAQSACCVPFVEDICEICAEPLTLNDANASLNGYELPCSTWETTLNKTECPAATPLLAPTCCAGGLGGTEVTSVPGPTPVPDPTPVSDQTLAPDPEPQAPSGASSRLSWVSLAVAATSAVMMMMIN